jgi:hypothetical protein
MDERCAEIAESQLGLLMGWSGRAPAPPAINSPVTPRDDALVEERDELRRKVDELMAKVRYAIKVLS